MITIKNKLAIQKMETAGAFLSDIFLQLPDVLRPGISTREVDAWIEGQLAHANMVSKTKGYHGYKHASCISVNDEVVHGVPSEKKILSEGDLVKVDICASWNGYCADAARTFYVGQAPDAIKHFVATAQQALDAGIAQMIPGNRLSDISAAIQHVVESNGYGVVRDFAGHGIGKQMHEDPEIVNYGLPGRGPVLRPGMAFAIEPMITMGNFKVYITHDGWTVRTVDKSLAAHIEDTVIITEGMPNVVTRKK